MRNMPPDFRLEDGRIDASKFVFQRDHLADLSTNLLGNFLPEDRAYQLTAEGKVIYQRLWLQDSKVALPRYPEHFYIASGTEAVFLQIKRIANLEIPYNVGEQDGFSAICTLRHTPIDANFWHVSLRWVNYEGDVLHQKGGWRKRMLTAARAALVELADTELPVDITPIPRALYTGE